MDAPLLEVRNLTVSYLQARCFYWQEVRVGMAAAAVTAAPAQKAATPGAPLLDVEGVVKEFARPLGAGWAAVAGTTPAC